MKVKLLNDGGYGDVLFKNIKFPVVVEGFYYDGMRHCVGVTDVELLRIGVNKAHVFGHKDLTFTIGEDCEVIK